MVNVLDVEYKAPEGDMLENIFNHQRQLMEKYHVIERDNGLLQTHMVPVDLDDKFGQARLKDFAWRTTEELAESLEAYYLKQHETVHAFEELIDGLHFLTEFSILAGVGPDDIAGNSLGGTDWAGDKLCHIWKSNSLAGVKEVEGYDFMLLAAKVIMNLGIACNCLKNKPWKQTHHTTDVQYFRRCVLLVWREFIVMLKEVGMKPDDIYDLYMRKNAVNKFRQRSQY